MICFGIVGGGWRTEFFLRIVRALPETFLIQGVVVRDAGKGADFERVWGVPTFRTLADLVQSGSMAFVVVSVPWGVSLGLIADCVERGLPVLGETPPASDLAGLLHLAGLVRQGGKIQVAEQYIFQPLHAARLAIARSGKLGTVAHAQVSAAHGYHGISLLRHYLATDFENATISATRTTQKIVQSPGRGGAPKAESIVDSSQVLAQFAFESGKFGVYDFTGDQYFSYIRGPRVLVRGERGEIDGQTVRFLLDHATGVEMPLLRHDTGQGGNLEGYFHRGYTLGGEWVYKNPFAPARLADDEIAIATVLAGMAEYANGGPDIYSLANAAQDRYLDLLMEYALRTDTKVHSETQSWAK